MHEEISTLRQSGGVRWTFVRLLPSPDQRDGSNCLRRGEATAGLKPPWRIGQALCRGEY